MNDYSYNIIQVLLKYPVVCVGLKSLSIAIVVVAYIADFTCLYAHPSHWPHTAFATNAIIILHICWAVLFFSGFDQIKLSGWPDLYIGVIKVFVVVLSHMLISALVSCCEIVR